MIFKEKLNVWINITLAIASAGYILAAIHSQDNVVATTVS